MLKTTHPLVLSLFVASIGWSDSLVLVTSQSAQNSTDSVAWSQLGVDNTIIAGPSFTVKSVAAAPVGVTLAGDRAIVAVVCSASPCSWTGAGFQARDTLLWTPDEANGGTGPVTLNFATPIVGGGAVVQADAPGPFTAEVQAFNGTTLLGSVSLDSDAAGDAFYIGIDDQTGARITSLVFSLTKCASSCTDLALSTVALNTSHPKVGISPNSLTFGNQSIGTTSAAQPVTLTNSGSAPLTITSIVTTGDYAATNTCGSSLAANASCTIDVTFHPTAAGTRTGAVTVTDNAGNPQAVGLTGNGTSSTSTVSLSPASLTFSGQPLGTASAAQAVQLKNTGTTTLTITSITATGDYSETNTCGSSVAAGATCSISVTFAPAATGTRTGAIVVSDNASGSPQSVNLTGTGTAPAVSLSPTSLTFGVQGLGTQSPSQALTLKNTGTAALAITSISTSGDFKETNTCGSSLAAGAMCTINVTFDPTATGTRTGTVRMLDNAPSGIQSVGLTGTGTNVALSPTNLNFPDTALGYTSAVQNVTLTNEANTPLTISGIALIGANSSDFSQTNGCGGSVAGGASCTIGISFHPTVAGTRTASVSITDSATGSPQSIALSGVGTGSAAAVSLSPNSLSFGSQQVGQSGASQVITLKNTGTAALTIMSIKASGDFSQTNTCGGSVAGGASCTISVTFHPTASGTRTGTITVLDNAAGGTQSASLTGIGVAPGVSLSPASLTFADQLVGTTSAAQSVKLTNTGSAPLSITSITASGDFAETNTCGSTVASAASCTISITFKPTATGVRNGLVTITDNSGSGSQVVTLSGNGTVPPTTVSISPTSVTFGSQAVGTTSAAQAVQLKNTGKTNLTVTHITSTGDYTETNTCSSPVAPGASCTITVTFTPSATGTRTGTIAINDNVSGSPQYVNLTGTGTAPAVSLSPTSLTFGVQGIGTTSASRSVTLANTGTASLNIASISTNGDFAQTNTCGSSLAPGATCTVTVTFTPTAAGSRTGTIRFLDNAPGGIQSVSLTGTGTNVALSATSLQFPATAVGYTSAPQNVTLTNEASTALSFSGIAIIGANPSDFSQTSGCGGTLAAGASCTISVTFHPTATGGRTAAVSISDSGNGSPQSVALAGTGG